MEALGSLVCRETGQITAAYWQDGGVEKGRARRRKGRVFLWQPRDDLFCGLRLRGRFLRKRGVCFCVSAEAGNRRGVDRRKENGPKLLPISQAQAHNQDADMSILGVA